MNATPLDPDTVARRLLRIQRVLQGLAPNTRRYYQQPNSFSADARDLSAKNRVFMHLLQGPDYFGYDPSSSDDDDKLLRLEYRLGKHMGRAFTVRVDVEVYANKPGQVDVHFCGTDDDGFDDCADYPRASPLNTFSWTSFWARHRLDRETAEMLRFSPAFAVVVGALYKLSRAEKAGKAWKQEAVVRRPRVRAAAHAINTTTSLPRLPRNVTKLILKKI